MTIDLTHIDTKAAFHMLMKRELGLPDWYGVSWDAFWDAIIAVVEMPDTVVLEHWETFAQTCPKDMQILHQIIADYHQEKPGKQFLLVIIYVSTPQIYRGLPNRVAFLVGNERCWGCVRFV